MVALVGRGFIPETVAMPPFTKGRKQFTKVQVEQAKTISQAHIHVERAIGHLLR